MISDMTFVVNTPLEAEEVDGSFYWSANAYSADGREYTLVFQCEHVSLPARPDCRDADPDDDDDLVKEGVEVTLFAAIPHGNTLTLERILVRDFAIVTADANNTSAVISAQLDAAMPEAEADADAADAAAGEVAATPTKKRRHDKAVISEREDAEDAEDAPAITTPAKTRARGPTRLHKGKAKLLGPPGGAGISGANGADASGKKKKAKNSHDLAIAIHGGFASGLASLKAQSSSPAPKLLNINDAASFEACVRKSVTTTLRLHGVVALDLTNRLLTVDGFFGGTPITLKAWFDDQNGATVTSGEKFLVGITGLPKSDVLGSQKTSVSLANGVYEKKLLLKNVLLTDRGARGADVQPYLKFLNRPPHPTSFEFLPIADSEAEKYVIPDANLLTHPGLLSLLEGTNTALGLCATACFLLEAYDPYRTSSNALLTKFKIAVPSTESPESIADSQTIELAFFGDTHQAAIDAATATLTAGSFPVSELTNFRLKRYANSGGDIVSLVSTATSTVRANSTAHLVSTLRNLLL